MSTVCVTDRRSSLNNRVAWSSAKIPHAHSLKKDWMVHIVVEIPRNESYTQTRIPAWCSVQSPGVLEVIIRLWVEFNLKTMAAAASLCDSVSHKNLSLKASRTTSNLTPDNAAERPFLLCAQHTQQIWERQNRTAAAADAWGSTNTRVSFDPHTSSSSERKGYRVAPHSNGPPSALWDGGLQQIFDVNCYWSELCSTAEERVTSRRLQPLLSL